VRVDATALFSSFDYNCTALESVNRWAGERSRGRGPDAYLQLLGDLQLVIYHFVIYSLS